MVESAYNHGQAANVAMTFEIDQVIMGIQLKSGTEGSFLNCRLGAELEMSRIRNELPQGHLYGYICL